MATIVATVNPGGGADYTSLNAARSALAQDLTGVTCDVQDALGATTIALDILLAGNAADSTAVVFGTEFTTDATHRIRIRTASGPTGPKWDTGKYRLTSTSSYTGTLSINAALHMDIDCQVENTTTLDNRPIALDVQDFASDVRVYGGFYRTTGTTGTTANQVAGIRNRQIGAGSVQVWNAACVSADGAGYFQVSNATTGAVVRLYNVLCVNRSANAQTVLYCDNASGADVRFKNCLLQGTPGASLFLVNYSAPDEKLTMLTQDTTGTTGLTSKTLTFVDATNWDYHLASGDTDAIGTGTNLSADSYLAFSVDGDGGTRSSWDIGPDEYGSPSTGTTFYLTNSTASSSNFGTIQVSGSAPSASTTSTGWTVDTVGSSNYALMAWNTERASSAFGGTALPSTSPNNTTGDCFRTATALTGDFATGTWAITIPVIAVTGASGQDGRVRIRLWKSSNADGSSATEITAGAVTGTTVTDLTTGAEQTSVATTSSITGFSLSAEYLFLQVAWEITGAAT